jgi:tryptophanyl-tRNA synthetase
MKRILTGDRPTGPLHLGHYVGSLQNRIKLQEEGYEMFNIIADLQVLTDRLETKDVEKNIKELVLDYLACGIDPEKTNIFIQSKVPQLSELFVYLSMLVNTGRVAQNPTVKEETKATGGGLMSLGMFSLGVSQAADILAFNADFVPVGEDQLPHLEQTRDLARSFNHHFGNVLKEPEHKLAKITRLTGLDGENKMSKSRGNAIFLSDTKEEVEKKIRSAVTDSESSIKYDPENRKNISNLIHLYLAAETKLKYAQDSKSVKLGDEKVLNTFDNEFNDKVNEIVGRYKDVTTYKEFKEDLANVINNFLDPIRERRKKEEAKGDEYINKILKDGTEKATEEAEKTMKLVRKAMKYDYKKLGF